MGAGRDAGCGAARGVDAKERGGAEHRGTTDALPPVLEELRNGCLVLLTLAALAFAALVVVWVVGGTSWLVLTNPTSHVQKVQVVLAACR